MDEVRTRLAPTVAGVATTLLQFPPSEGASCGPSGAAANGHDKTTLLPAWLIPNVGQTEPATGMVAFSKLTGRIEAFVSATCRTTGASPNAKATLLA